MATLHVIDNKISENSFVTNDVHMFFCLKEITNIYGDDCVTENWDALLNHQQIEWSLSSNHVASIRIDRQESSGQVS